MAIRGAERERDDASHRMPDDVSRPLAPDDRIECLEHRIERVVVTARPGIAVAEDVGSEGLDVAQLALERSPRVPAG
jgi:hypothetical protein